MFTQECDSRTCVVSLDYSNSFYDSYCGSNTAPCDVRETAGLCHLALMIILESGYYLFLLLLEQLKLRSR